MAGSRKIAHLALWLIVGAFLVTSLVMSRRLDVQQNGSRDLSRPSTRLIGHWQIYSKANEPAGAFYFGEPGEDGLGVLLMQDPSGLLFDHRYAVVSEKRHGRSLRIRHFLSPEQSRTEDLYLAKNGLSAQHTQVFFDELLTRRLQYVDAATTPGPEASEVAAPSTLPLSR